LAINWIRVTMAALVILAVGTFVLSADTVAEARDGTTFCKNFCRTYHKEYGGMNKCMSWCKYNYFEQAR